VETIIRFVSGDEETFDGHEEIKMTPLGVEVISRDGEDSIRVLFPWARIERVTQRGPQIAAIYTY
jgi:hypothetical protein